MNPSKSFLLFFSVFSMLLTACKQQNLEQVEAVDSYGYIEKYARKKTDYTKQGAFEKYNKNGVKVEEATFVNDTLHGVRILYTESGDTQTLETYQMGIFEGPFRAYYENGKLEIDGQFVANETYGEWKRYYATGELMEIVTFAENAENGPFTEFYTNGQKKAEGYYRNGEEEGLLKKYNTEGKLVWTMDCKEGICTTVWKDESLAEQELEE